MVNTSASNLLASALSSYDVGKVNLKPFGTSHLLLLRAYKEDDNTTDVEKKKNW